MRISKITISVLLMSHTKVAQGFRIGSDGNPDMMKQAVENALLKEVMPLEEFPIAVDSESLEKSICAHPPLKNQIAGTEESCTLDYWSRPDIHTLGNIGLGGAVHAAMAPMATKLIDMKAYGGEDVRKLLSQELRFKAKKVGARVIDLCCGVGMSTRALDKAFHDAEFIVGVDTSPEMVSMANAITNHELGVERAWSRHLEGIMKLFKEGLSGNMISETFGLNSNPSPVRSKHSVSYRLGNAENTKLPKKSFDLVTIMYGFHEVPMDGRSRIINEAKRLLRRGGSLAIVDICPTYQPSEHMLAGEPYVLGYQQTIDNQLANFPGFNSAQRKVIVPGHVIMWLLTRKESSTNSKE